VGRSVAAIICCLQGDAHEPVVHRDTFSGSFRPAEVK